MKWGGGGSNEGRKSGWRDPEKNEVQRVPIFCLAKMKSEKGRGGLKKGRVGQKKGDQELRNIQGVTEWVKPHIQDLQGIISVRRNGSI